jgi:hypothetical protein
MAVSLLFLGPGHGSGLAMFSVCRDSVVGLYISVILRVGIHYVQFVLERI